MMVVTQDYLDVSGGRLYFEVAAPDGGPAAPPLPALTLIHAGVANLRMWDEHVPAFAGGGYRVIRYDTRGFGRTQSDDVPFSNRDDIRQLLDHLSVAKIALVGISRGGTIALGGRGGDARPGAAAGGHDRPSRHGSRGAGRSGPPECGHR